MKKYIILLALAMPGLMYAQSKAPKPVAPKNEKKVDLYGVRNGDTIRASDVKRADVFDTAVAAALVMRGGVLVTMPVKILNRKSIYTYSGKVMSVEYTGQPRYITYKPPYVEIPADSVWESKRKQP